MLLKKRSPEASTNAVRAKTRKPVAYIHEYTEKQPELQQLRASFIARRGVDIRLAETLAPFIFGEARA